MRGSKIHRLHALLLPPNLSEPLEDGDGESAVNLRWLTLAALVLSAGVALGKDARIEADPFLNFVVGDYVIVGREPDRGRPYSGTARVELREGGLLLNRRRGSMR